MVLRITSALVVLTAGVVGQLLLVKGEKDAALLLAGCVLVTLAGSAAVGILLKRVFGSGTAQRSVDEAADALAVAVRGQWEAAAVERSLVSPMPIPVRWKWTDLAVAGPVMDAIGDRAVATRFRELPGLGRIGAEQIAAGRVQDLFSVYGGLDSGRSVIVGRAGAGKTGAAVLLVSDALKHRERLNDPDRRLTPVPVLLNCRTWDPIRTSFPTWLSEQLRTSYSFLRAMEYGADVTDRLVAQGRIAALLDGFDEVPAGLRPNFLGALNAQANCRLVLLTRELELVNAVQRGHLAGAAVLELLPVNRDDAADYLERCRVRPASAAWRRLVTHLRSDVDPVITGALSTPLTLTLVRDTFLLDGQVEELLTSCRFHSSDDVVDFLLDRVVPAAYTSRPGRPDPRYTPEQATRWLGFIAARMNADAIHDLAWWRIPDWQPSLLRAAANGVIAAAVFAALGSLAFGPLFGLTAFLAGLVAGCAVGAFAEWYPDDRPVQVVPIRWRALGSPRINTLDGIALVMGLGYGTVGGSIVAIEGGSTFGLTFGIAVALAFHLSVAVSALIAQPSDEPGSPIDPITAWRRDRGAGIVIGASFAIAFGALTAVAFGLTFGPVRGLTFGIAGSVVAGTAISLTLIRTWDSRLAFFQLWKAGHGPLLLMDFLEDARQRGVLRTVGPVSQFRHARLQDRLAEQSRTTTNVSPRHNG